MKKFTNKEVLDFVKSIADLKPSTIPEDESQCWYSKVDGSYLTHEKLYVDLSYLLSYGITEQIQAPGEDKRVSCIGFNPVEQKWYGWSHRAIYGFGVGSEVKKGSCGYVSTDIDDFLESCVRFWQSESHTNVSAIAVTNDEGITGAQVTWEYVPEEVPNETLHGTIGRTFDYPPKKWGKGEWKAKTIEDAKQMAIDFAAGVS